ncbi:MAG: hypothetical protein KTR31_21610 [Myxococcales bacterium]|nr:hypothetical protein [Myxococcales bacterium]
MAWLCVAWMALGCGDACEQLCTQTAERIDTCRPDSLLWEDLGAESPNDFSRTCQRQWDRERIRLSAGDLSVALQVCRDTDAALRDLTCEEVRALDVPTP